MGDPQNSGGMYLVFFPRRFPFPFPPFSFFPSPSFSSSCSLSTTPFFAFFTFSLLLVSSTFDGPHLQCLDVAGGDVGIFFAAGAFARVLGGIVWEQGGVLAVVVVVGMRKQADVAMMTPYSRFGWGQAAGRQQGISFPNIVPVYMPLWCSWLEHSSPLIRPGVQFCMSAFFFF